MKNIIQTRHLSANKTAPARACKPGNCQAKRVLHFYHFHYFFFFFFFSFFYLFQSVEGSTF